MDKRASKEVWVTSGEVSEHCWGKNTYIWTQWRGQLVTAGRDYYFKCKDSNEKKNFQDNTKKSRKHGITRGSQSPSSNHQQRHDESDLLDKEYKTAILRKLNGL